MTTTTSLRHVTIRHHKRAARCPYCRRHLLIQGPCLHYVGTYPERGDALLIVAGLRAFVQAEPPVYQWGQVHNPYRPWYVFQELSADQTRAMGLRQQRQSAS